MSMIVSSTYKYISCMTWPEIFTLCGEGPITNTIRQANNKKYKHWARIFILRFCWHFAFLKCVSKQTIQFTSSIAKTIAFIDVFKGDGFCDGLPITPIANTMEATVVYQCQTAGFAIQIFKY